MTTCSVEAPATQRAFALTFGEVLDDLLDHRHLSQKQFAELIYRSEADVSRLVNNRIPKTFHCTDLDFIAAKLDCSRVEYAGLVIAYAHFLLDSHGITDIRFESDSMNIPKPVIK